MSAYENFCSDPLRTGRYLYEVHYKTTAGVAGVLYYSSSAYGTQATDTPASQRYDARVGTPFSFTGSAGQTGDGGIYPMVGLLPAREGGTFSIMQKFGDLDHLRAFNFDNQKIVVRYGGESKYGELAYADYREIFNGVCQGQPLIGIDEVTFKLRNRDNLLYFPVQTTKYHGGNWCLYASGGGQQINFTNNSVYNFTSGKPFTFEFWYFPVTSGVQQYVFARGGSSTNGYQIFQTSADKITFRTSQSGATQDTISTVLTMERWNHIAIAYNGAASAKIYINGALAVVVAGSHIAPATSTSVLYAFRRDAGGELCDCMMKEVRIWKRALTRAEVQKRMERQLNEVEAANADLVGYWKFDDGTGLVAKDDSATAQNGALSASGVIWLPSLQGGEELQGAVIPDTWGEKYGMKPVLVHAQTQIYQVHSSFIEGIMDDGVLEGLNPLKAGAAPNPYIYNFLQLTTAPGKYTLLNSAQGSYIRLGSAPSLPLSVNLKGDKSDGTYRDNPVDLARYIVTTRGQFKLSDADDIDDAAFDAVAAELVLGSATDVPVKVGVSTYDETMVGDLVTQLLGGVGVSAWFKRNGGRFTVKRHKGAGVGTAVAQFDRTDIKLKTLEALDAGSPVYMVSIGWRKNDVVHNVNDIAGAMRGTAAQAFGMKDWRIAAQPSYETLEAYPSASTISLESCISYWIDALAEALRLQGIYSKMPQAFKAFFKHRSVDLERLDIIGLHYQDYNPKNELQDRFGTMSEYIGGVKYSTQYVVLNIEEVTKEGGTMVTFSREDNTVDHPTIIVEG